MPTKTTRINAAPRGGQGPLFEVICNVTNNILHRSESEEEAVAWQRDYEKKIQSAASAHIFIDGKKIGECKPEYGYHVTSDAIGVPLSGGVGKITPYFGDPSRPFGDKYGKVFEKTIGIDAAKIDLDKLREMIEPTMITANDNPAWDVRLDELLKTVPMRDMINAVFWQMAKKEGFPGVFQLTDDQYNDICNYIFDNYVAPQDASRHAPHKRPIDPKVLNAHVEDLLYKLNSYEGIKTAKFLYEDYPRKASILIVVDPAFEFQDAYHMEEWECDLALMLKKGKPKGLDKLEIIFNRTEVF